MSFNTRFDPSFFRKDDTNIINWYTCGPTIYNDSHLGHARTYILTDCMIRYLEVLGYKVLYGMNITDVDDKILNKVLNIHLNKIFNTVGEYNENLLSKLDEESLSNLKPPYEEFSNFRKIQEQSFFDDMINIGNKVPDVVARVTDSIDNIIAYIKVLIDEQFAYQSNGSVYMKVDYFESIYGKCDFAPIVSINIEPTEKNFVDDKLSINDFVLWKKVKQYEISWPSPWGPGRPGWHIECSSIIESIFKSNLHVHAGGIDLKFPHHCNEWIQTCSYTNNPKWIKSFIHVGHLHINNEKMSQSTNNFITIKTFLQKYTLNQIRLAFLNQKYSSNTNINEEMMIDAIRLDKSLGGFMSKIKFRINNSINLSIINNEVNSSFILRIKLLYNQIIESLNNDFNTPSVLLMVCVLMEDINKSYWSTLNKNSFIEIYDLLQFVTKIFGLRYDSETNHDLGNIDNVVSLIVKCRTEIKNLIPIIDNINKKKYLYQLSDTIRDKYLPEIGYTLEDTDNGPIYYNKIR